MILDRIHALGFQVPSEKVFGVGGLGGPNISSEVLQALGMHLHRALWRSAAKTWGSYPLRSGLERLV